MNASPSTTWLIIAQGGRPRWFAADYRVSSLEIRGQRKKHRQWRSNKPFVVVGDEIWRYSAAVENRRHFLMQFFFERSVRERVNIWKSLNRRWLYLSFWKGRFVINIILIKFDFGRPFIGHFFQGVPFDLCSDVSILTHQWYPRTNRCIRIHKHLHTHAIVLCKHI